MLGSLRGLYAHAKPYPNPQIIVADYWAQVQILLGKNLISQVYKTIRQAKKHCAVYHLDADALKFRMAERTLISRREKKGALEKLEKLRLECRKLQRDPGHGIAAHGTLRAILCNPDMKMPVRCGRPWLIVWLF
ncbi:MAG: hypothetical protein IPJ40_20205 [Saprospirales bacterium]|nr:hypothetical protein [Saprospirales bacterium]